MAIFEKMLSRFKSLSERTMMVILAFVVGLCSGLMAVLLKKLISLIHTGLTGWFDAPVYNYLYLVYPGIGMLLAYLFVRYFVHDDISHGVTKVLLSVSKQKSIIAPHNIWSSVGASAMTIGFGGSVGAEAPIVYSGAAIGSNIARALKLPYKDVTILLGCGAASAIAGIFSAPLAGVLFTLEILLFNISMSSILTLLLSSVTATVVSYIFTGTSVSFPSTLQEFSMGNLPFYLLLGIFCGAMSLYFMRTSLWLEDKMRNIRRPMTRWILCAAMLGLLIFFFPPLYGEGYDSLTMMLNNNSVDIAGGVLGTVLTNKWAIWLFFVAILLAKVFATAFTNAGGGVGGTFGPTLFTGGIAGFVVARFLNMTGIHAVPEANFVLVGMAGMMAGVMQAPMTAIFLIAELTGGYDLLLPLILTSAASFATIRTVEPYSIYTKRIASQGDLLTHDNDRAVLTLLRLQDFIEKDFKPIIGDRSLADLVKVIASSNRNVYPVLDHEKHFIGIIFLNDVREVMFDHENYYKIHISEFLKAAPAVVYSDEKMETVMEKFELTNAWNLPVVDRDGVYLGFVSKSKIFSSYREQLQQVSHE
ncbi:MAG: chloride channel protein [Bacteroidales bacterium]|nr:chloride channel protein [Bacteroidales bacterium]